MAKNRIEQLLFYDRLRLPLLSLLPLEGTLEDLPQLRAALIARLGKVEESVNSTEGKVSVVVSEEQSIERDEREMLKVALDWISLQEE